MTHYNYSLCTEDSVNTAHQSAGMKFSISITREIRLRIRLWQISHVIPVLVVVVVIPVRGRWPLGAAAHVDDDDSGGLDGVDAVGRAALVERLVQSLEGLESGKGI